VISETECVFYKADDALRSTVSIIHWTWKTNDGSGAAEYPEGFSITGAITFDTTASNIGFRQLFTPYLKTDRSAFNSGDVWIKQ
jgi:hypothetical protein